MPLPLHSPLLLEEAPVPLEELGVLAGRLSEVVHQHVLRHRHPKPRSKDSQRVVVI